jgi:hypothetical protein
MHTIIGAHAPAPGVIPARSSSKVSVSRAGLLGFSLELLALGSHDCYCIGSLEVQYQGMPEGPALGIPYGNGADAEQFQAR